jgi:methylmalonyl-CoA mutase N-terminal domain/subunit
LQQAKAQRDQDAVERQLAALQAAAKADINLIDLIIAAAEVGATEGELVRTLQAVFGIYTETPVY